MDRKSAESLKEELLAEVGRSPSQKGPQLHSMAKQPPTDQMAIGFSRPSKTNYTVEIRVQRPDGSAYEAAEEYRLKHNSSEVNIQVVPQVQLLPYVADFKKAAPTARLPAHPARQLQLGLSVSRGDTDAGTLGAFLRVKGEDDYFLLSCNHVLAKLNNGSKGDHTYHPGRPDQSPLGNKHRIARLESWNDLATDTLNQFDAAIARINSDVENAGNQIPVNIPNAGTKIKAFAGDPIDDIRLNHPVRLVGRTSGDSWGKVTAVGVGPQAVFAAPLGKILFGDIIEVVGDDGPFSRPGDSGSLVFLADTFEAIGLLFGGGRIEKDDKKVDVSYVCLLSGILDFFEAKLL